MAFSSASLCKNRQAMRSISLPTRSHPKTLQVEEELTGLKRWEASISWVPDAETICTGLTSLDRSMRLLDICCSVSDLVAQVKEHVRDVQSALRRRKGDFIIDASFLKKLRKDANRSIADMKQIDHIYGSKPLNLYPYLSSVIRVLRDVSEISISVFGLLLSFLSVSILKPNSLSKWSKVSKFIQKEQAVSKDQPPICIEALDYKIEGTGSGLDCMFRKLIRTRTSLLNILSH
nr:hypothetical protein [Tanacetum cinerariifolium]